MRLYARVRVCVCVRVYVCVHARACSSQGTTATIRLCLVQGVGRHLPHHGLRTAHCRPRNSWYLPTSLHPSGVFVVQPRLVGTFVGCKRTLTGGLYLRTVAVFEIPNYLVYCSARTTYMNY